MKFRSPRPHPDMGFQIAPMIDVVFVIMLFFMVMAGGVKTERELNLRLPGIPTPDTTAREPDEIVIGVPAAGELTLNESPVDAGALAREITLLRQNAERSNATRLVTIAAEETAAYEKIAATLEALAIAKAGHVTFAIAANE